MLFFIIFLFALLFPLPVHAVYDPLSVPNNKFGIHIAEFNDIPDLPALVNSNGGDWGYVTLVASDNDRDSEKWQRMFDQMRRLHLIPIVRLATHPEATGWKKPDPANIREIVRFFTSLNWPIENRYIILYNEPNHANEWGGSIDPEGYASIALEFIRTFKEASDDFFILLAGLDVSAASDGSSLDAAEYLRRVTTSQPELVNLFDGWTSHSYPNPAFSGSPYATGRGTLRSYDWELGYLRTMGLTKDLPVFITETGWTHSQGKVMRYNLLSPESVGVNLGAAAVGAWSDNQIAAVTPFVFNYQDVPFDNFSWKRLGDNGYYAQYDAYKAIAKTKGTPKQHEEYVLSESLLPPTLVTASSYSLSTTMINKGQGILNPNDSYEMTFDDGKKGFTFVADPLPVLEPNQKGKISIHLKTPQDPGTYHVSLAITHSDRVIPVQTREIAVVPPPALKVEAQLGWRATSETSDVSVLVYDGNTMIQKMTGLTMNDGTVEAKRLTNVIPGREYRVVILVPYYLPRQSILALGPKETLVHMKRLYPFDIDGDGRFTLSDIWTLITKRPHNIINLFVGP